MNLDLNQKNIEYSFDGINFLYYPVWKNIMIHIATHTTIFYIIRGVLVDSDY